MASATPPSPTFYGYVDSTLDVLLLVEACLRGDLNSVTRRPQYQERIPLIRSGNVFIHSSGIKRWTDGVTWSPSRRLENFLIYRELEQPFQPGTKRKTIRKAKSSAGISKQGRPSSKKTDSLIGSLVDSYNFKEEGLVKKTLSIRVYNVLYCLVSYYRVADVKSNKFTTPSEDARFRHIIIRPELIPKQSSHIAIDEGDAVEYRPVYANGYGMPSQTTVYPCVSLVATKSCVGNTPDILNPTRILGLHHESPDPYIVRPGVWFGP